MNNQESMNFLVNVLNRAIASHFLSSYMNFQLLEKHPEIKETLEAIHKELNANPMGFIGENPQLFVPFLTTQYPEVQVMSSAEYTEMTGTPAEEIPSTIHDNPAKEQTDNVVPFPKRTVH